MVGRPKRRGLWIKKNDHFDLGYVLRACAFPSKKSTSSLIKCTLHTVIKDEGSLLNFEFKRAIYKIFYKLGVKCNKP